MSSYSSRVQTERKAAAAVPSSLEGEQERRAKGVDISSRAIIVAPSKMPRCGTPSGSVPPSRASGERRTSPLPLASAGCFLSLPDIAHAAIAAHLSFFDVLRVSMCCKATGLIYMATISGARFAEDIQPGVLVSLMSRLRAVKMVKLGGKRGLECFLTALEQTEDVWASVERLEACTETAPSLCGATARVPSLKQLQLTGGHTLDSKPLGEALGEGAWRNLSSLIFEEAPAKDGRRPLADHHAMVDGLEKRVRKGLPGITAFVLEGSSWGFKDLQQLLVGGKGCTSLQSLDLTVCDNTDSHVDVVAAYLASPNSAHLRELVLGFEWPYDSVEGRYDSVVIELGQGHRPLTSLRLVEGSIGGEALRSLADGVARKGALKELRELSLESVSLGQGGWTGLFEAVGRSHGWSNVRKLCLGNLEDDGLLEGFASSVQHGAFTALQDLQLRLYGDVAPLAEAFKHNHLSARCLRKVEIVALYGNDTGFISDWAKAFEVDGQFVDGLKELRLCDEDDKDILSPKDADMQALARLLVRGFGRHLEGLRLPIRASTASFVCAALLACAWTELKVLELSFGHPFGHPDEDGHWDADAVEAVAYLLGGGGATAVDPDSLNGPSMARLTRALTTLTLNATMMGHDNVSLLLDALVAPTAVRLQTLNIEDWPKDERLWDRLMNVLVGNAGSKLQTITISGTDVSADWLLRIAAAIMADRKVLPALASFDTSFCKLPDSERAAHASLESVLKSRRLMG